MAIKRREMITILIMIVSKTVLLVSVCNCVYRTFSAFFIFSFFFVLSSLLHYLSKHYCQLLSKGHSTIETESCCCNSEQYIIIAVCLHTVKNTLSCGRCGCQIWRPVTALFFFPLMPQTGFQYLLNLYFLYSYSTRLETGMFLYLMTSFTTSPCGLLGCKNRPAPFPVQMS